MDRVIACECGYTIRGATDAELLANAKAHIAQAHPELIDKITDADFLAMAQEL